LNQRQLICQCWSFQAKLCCWILQVIRPKVQWISLLKAVRFAKSTKECRLCGSTVPGPFLLTHLLTDSLVAPGGKSRVVNVSSAAHRRAVMDFDDIMMKKDFRGLMAYSRSKLANILFSRELARRCGGLTCVYILEFINWWWWGLACNLDWSCENFLLLSGLPFFPGILRLRLEFHWLHWPHLLPSLV